MKNLCGGNKKITLFRKNFIPENNCAGQIRETQYTEPSYYNDIGHVFSPFNKLTLECTHPPNLYGSPSNNEMISYVPTALPTPPSKYLKVYVEDCTQAATLTYDDNTYNQQLKGLDLIGIDFSKNCYSHASTFIQLLIKNNYPGKIYIHYDQTKTSKTCGQNLPADPGNRGNYQKKTRNRRC